MFDETLLDDAEALATADGALRSLAEAGARVRREAGETADALDAAAALLRGSEPRAVVAAGPDSRLLRAVLEPACPVPFVAWPHPRLPGWAGGLDLVVVLAPDGSDHDAASAVAEATRRGSSLIVAAPARSLVAEHAQGRDTVLIPTSTGDQLATAVILLELLHRLELAPRTRHDTVADALDRVAVACSPFVELTENPAKELACALGDATPVLWGGTVLAARAARRVAESMRISTGRAVLAADVEQVLTLVESAPERDVFADPFADVEDGPLRPSLVVLDDGSDDAAVREQRSRLLAAAERRGVRVDTVRGEADDELARYAALVATGRYAAAYLGVGSI